MRSIEFRAALLSKLLSDSQRCLVLKTVFTSNISTKPVMTKFYDNAKGKQGASSRVDICCDFQGHQFSEVISRQQSELP